MSVWGWGKSSQALGVGVTFSTLAPGRWALGGRSSLCPPGNYDSRVHQMRTGPWPQLAGEVVTAGISAVL